MNIHASWLAIALLAGSILTGGSAAAGPGPSAPEPAIRRAGTQPSATGSPDQFTGSVRIDPLFQATDPRRAAGALVTFEPGARTAWHTHPLGQTLIVTAGVGRVQLEGGRIEEIRPGDVVSIPADQRHWHGAAPNTAMTHLAIHEHLDGKVVAWGEHVSDAQYGGK